MIYYRCNLQRPECCDSERAPTCNVLVVVVPPTALVATQPGRHGAGKWWFEHALLLRTDVWATVWQQVCTHRPIVGWDRLEAAHASTVANYCVCTYGGAGLNYCVHGSTHGRHQTHMYFASFERPVAQLLPHSCVRGSTGYRATWALNSTAGCLCFTCGPECTRQGCETGCSEAGCGTRSSRVGGVSDVQQGATGGPSALTPKVEAAAGAKHNR